MPTKALDSKNIRVFISYRRKGLSNNVAAELAKHLSEDYGYTVFYDKQELVPKAGVEWKKEIFENARKSDVLIVLVENITDSEWVQREVDVARGANVSLLPIPIGDISGSDVTEKLLINDLQWSDFNPITPDYEKLASRIESLSKDTRANQAKWFSDLKELRRTKSPDKTEPRVAAFHLADVPNIRVNIAHGDMTELGAVDVLVNTENNYMQMARVYENDTLSSKLRFRGSYITNKVNIEEDTVQHDLDEIIARTPEIRRRPVAMHSVIVTHAGHEKSSLRRKVNPTTGKKTGSRYIFHVASVHMNPANNTITPVIGDEIVQCVVNALEQVLEVNRATGVISPAGCANRKKEQKIADANAYEPIASIAFPLFGAGRGGQPASTVIPLMVDGIKRFLRTKGDDPDQSLREITLCIFSESDLRVARQAFIDRKFAEVTS